MDLGSKAVAQSLQHLDLNIHFDVVHCPPSTLRRRNSPSGVKLDRGDPSSRAPVTKAAMDESACIRRVTEEVECPLQLDQRGSSVIDDRQMKVENACGGRTVNFSLGVPDSIEADDARYASATQEIRRSLGQILRGISRSVVGGRCAEEAASSKDIDRNFLEIPPFGAHDCVWV